MAFPDRRSYKSCMVTSRELWLVVADSDTARLLHGTATRHDHVHLDEVAKLQTTAVASERQRPTRLSQPGRSGPVEQDHEFEVAHFAKQIATWIGQELPARGVSRCALFAPTHLIGALRKSLPAVVAGKLTEHAGELAQLSLDELSRHPKVVALMPAR